MVLPSSSSRLPNSCSWKNQSKGCVQFPPGGSMASLGLALFDSMGWILSRESKDSIGSIRTKYLESTFLIFWEMLESYVMFSRFSPCACERDFSNFQLIVGTNIGRQGFADRFEQDCKIPWKLSWFESKKGYNSPDHEVFSKPPDDNHPLMSVCSPQRMGGWLD